MSLAPTPNNQKPLNNGQLTPEEGPVEFPIWLDFTSSSEVEVDFTQAFREKRATVIQTLVIHNRNNSADLTITIDGVEEIVTVSGNTDVCIPVLAPNLPKFTFNTTPASGRHILVNFVNIMLPSYQLGLLPVTFPAGTTIEVTGTVDIGNEPIDVVGTVAISNTVTITTNIPTATAGDSHKITAGGTAQKAMTGPMGGGSFIVNTDTAESLFVDIVNTPTTVAPGANGTTVEILPGGGVFAVPGAGIKNNVSVIAATTNHEFVAVKIS